MKKKAKSAPKKTRKPQTPAVPVGSPLPVAAIVANPPPLVAPLHVGMVGLESLPRDAWPSPSPVELATVAGACGWANQADGAAKALEFLWKCAEVIHESRESAGNFVESIRNRNERTADELRQACRFDYQKLPDKITRPVFLECFKPGRLKVAGKELREWDLVNHWLCLPEGMGMTPHDLEAWHARHKKGFDCARFTIAERWEMLAVMVARFNEWRKETARRNNPWTKNLKRGEIFPCKGLHPVRVADVET